MSNPVINLISAAYAVYKTQHATLVAAQATLTGLGPRPVLPEIVATDADFEDTEAAQNTWDTAYAAALATITTQLPIYRAAEAGVTEVLFPDQWVELNTTNGTTPISPTVWIGVASADPAQTLETLTAEPLYNFPGKATA